MCTFDSTLLSFVYHYERQRSELKGNVCLGLRYILEWEQVWNCNPIVSCAQVTQSSYQPSAEAP